MKDTQFNTPLNIDHPKLSQISELKALWQEAFGDSPLFIDSFFKTAFSQKRCRCITNKDKILSALYWFDCSYEGGKIAYIYAVATAESHRGNGLCKLLMENTHAHLKELGYACSVLVPGSRQLFDFYEKLGYQLFGKIRTFSADAAEKTVKTKIIDPDEYIKLRKELLPKGAVIQENENIAFLKTQASFYTGNGFLLAGSSYEGRFFCAEILGNTDKAAEILAALGCKTGRFRTPGKDQPFAMYRPICDEISAPPSYFGLAFD